MRRVFAGAFVIAVSLLAADALMKDTDLVDGARLWLLIATLVSAVLFLATTKTVSPHVPSVGLDRDRVDHSASLRVRLPEAMGAKRLRNDTLDLVAEMHAHVQNAPPFYAPDPDSSLWRPVKSEEETAALHEQMRRHQAEMSSKYDRARLENLERFGGRTQKLLTEYVRRKMLTDKEKSKLMWFVETNDWMARELAVRLEALARQL